MHAKKIVVIALVSLTAIGTGKESVSPTQIFPIHFANFFHTRNIRYIPTCKWENASLIDKSSITIPEAKESEKYAQLIRKKYTVPVYIQFIDDAIGYGVFADTDIQPGQMIGEYAGIIKKYKPKGAQNKEEVHNESYRWKYGSDILDAFDAGNFTRFINHSYNPNLEARYIKTNDNFPAHLIYIARKPIKKGEQLLINYGAHYWSNPLQNKPVNL